MGLGLQKRGNAGESDGKENRQWHGLYDLGVLGSGFRAEDLGG